MGRPSNANHSSLRFKRHRGDKKAKVQLAEEKLIHQVQHPPKKRKNKAAKRTKNNPHEKFPGLDKIQTEISEELSVGEGILSFIGENTSNVEKNESNIKELNTVDVAKNITPNLANELEEDFISIDDKDYDELNEITFHAPWMHDDVIKPIDSSVAAKLSSELLEFMRYVSPNKEELAIRKQCVNRLTSVVLSMWPTAKVEIFGSYATGMFLPEADIDIVIMDSGSMSHKLRSEMYRLGNKLRVTNVCSKVEVIGRARVPIVKYVDAKSGINVDIAFGQTSGLDVVSRVCGWLRENKALKPLSMFVRQFLKRRELSDVAFGGLGGYATICMAYSRLMQWKLDLKPDFKSNTWLENVGLLLIDFFDFYGNLFDNQNMVVRVNSSFKPYPRRLNGNMVTKQNQGIAIEDPNDKDNNISKGTYNYISIKRSFESAASYLKGLAIRFSESNERTRENISFLAPLLLFNENEPRRIKIALDLALQVPEEATLNPVVKPKTNPNVMSGQKDIADSIRAFMTARPPNKRGPRGQKRNKPESKPVHESKKPKIDPWSGKQEKLVPEKNIQQKKEVIDLTNVDEDSRIKLTSSERRNFWKGKGGSSETGASKIQASVDTD